MEHITRAAAYCRVSTDLLEQQSSFENQKAFFRSYIESHPGWELVEIYADEGITGTSAEAREGFMRMLNDAERGSFKLLLTKEVSRFSRNLLDTVRYTRELKALGVGVIFLNDGISTLDSDAELRLGIMASVAQEESRKTSERVRWGQQRMMERGVVFGRSMLGYRAKNGMLLIEPSGAGLVRRIYDMYINGNMGIRTIAKTLTDEKIETANGKHEWAGATILKILKNERYCGDLIQHKTYTPDYLTHRKKRNTGQIDTVCLYDHHEPIIERSAWNAVQAELNRRRPSNDNISAHGNRYALSGKIKCTRCGKAYTARTRKNSNNKISRIWYRGCLCEGISRSLKEKDIVIMLKSYLSCLKGKTITDSLLKTIDDSLTLHSPSTDLEHAKEATEKRLKRLLDIYLSGDIEKELYIDRKKKLNETLHELNAKQNRLEAKDVAGEIQRVLICLLNGADEDANFYLSLVESVKGCENELFTITLRQL